MTAHALVEERQRCLDAGMNDHVSKPIDPDNLFATLLRWAKPRPNQAAEIQSVVPDPKASEEVAIARDLRRQGHGRSETCRRQPAALSRLSGAICRKEGDAPADEVSVAIESGDLKLAERIAHTVKGVAGNIGIMEVQSVAQRLEKALRDGEERSPAPLVEFASVMGTQVQAINKALVESASNPRQSRCRFRLSMERLRLLRLLGLGFCLKQVTATPKSRFAVCRMPWRVLSRSPSGWSPIASINDFDFDAALLKLR